MGVKDNNGTYRFIALVDTTVFTKMYAKTYMNAISVPWINDVGNDQGVALVLSKDSEWHLTAPDDVNGAVIVACEDMRGEMKDPYSAVTKEQVQNLKDNFGLEDSINEWSSYYNNLQHSFQAMRITDPNADQSDKTARPPVYKLNNPSDIPYEGSKVKMATYMYGLPAWFPRKDVDPIGFGTLDNNHTMLHPCMHWYDGVDPTSDFSDIQTILNADPSALHADGGIVGYDLDSEDAVVSSVPKFGACVPATAPGDDSLPTGTVSSIAAPNPVGNVVLITEGSKTGGASTASLSAPDGNGIQTMTDAGAFDASMDGKPLFITGADNASNNVNGVIATYVDADTMTFYNPTGVVEAATAGKTWRVAGYSLIAIDVNQFDGTGLLISAIPGTLSAESTASITYATGAITANGVTWGGATYVVPSGTNQFWQAITGWRTQQSLLEASWLLNNVGENGVTQTAVLGVMFSDEVGSSEVPNSALTTKTSVTGTGDSLSAPDASGMQTLTDAAGLFTADMDGTPLFIPDATNDVNKMNGYRIVYVSSTQIKVYNPNGVAETSSFTWRQGHHHAKIRGIVPRATCIVYTADQGTPGAFLASKLLRAIQRAIDHKCQIFFQPVATNFFNKEQIFSQIFDAQLRAAEQADLLIVASAGNAQTDYDKSRSVNNEWLLGERGHILLVGGTGPRDYDPQADDLDVYTPDNARSPQVAQYNLDRPYIESANLFYAVAILGYGTGQTQRLDVVAPAGAIDPLMVRAIPIPFFLMKYSMTITATPGNGGFGSLGGFSVDEEGLGPHGWIPRDTISIGHAAACCAVAIEAWTLKKGSAPSAKKVKLLQRKYADGAVGPEKDFSFVLAPMNSTYATDPRYTLARDPDNNGDRFGYPQYTFLLTPQNPGQGFGMENMGMWYSFEHPADASRGKDPLMGKGRVNPKDMIDAIHRGNP